MLVRPTSEPVGPGLELLGRVVLRWVAITAAVAVVDGPARRRPDTEPRRGR
jgi:hypothetical protein